MKYIDKTGAISYEEKEGFYPVIEDVKPEVTLGFKVKANKLEWKDTYWLQTYRLESLPFYTAGEWLELVGVGVAQQPTLIYLKLQLMAALKKSDKLTAMEQYVSGILAQYAADPSPRNDWQQPPYSFHETVAEVTELLSSGN